VFILFQKSCANLWSESGDRDLDLELTRGLLFIPRAQGLTGLAVPSTCLAGVNPLLGLLG
jgi:hypothetical protein